MSVYRIQLSDEILCNMTKKRSFGKKLRYVFLVFHSLAQRFVVGAAACYQPPKILAVVHVL